MTKIARKTRSATRLEESQRVKKLIKGEEDTDNANAHTSQEEFAATSSIGPTVKVEENDANLKQIFGSEKGRK